MSALRFLATFSEAIIRMTVAILVSGSLPAWATGTAEMTTAHAQAHDPLLTKADLELKNFYINRGYQTTQFVNPSNPAEGKNPKTQESWAQGAMLNLESGYFVDVIGFDLSLFGALKLVGDEGKFGTDALRNVTPHLKGDKFEADQRSYSKIGQAFIKAKLGNETFSGHIRGGAMMINTPLLNESETRTTPSSHAGVYGDINWQEKCRLYGIYSNRVSPKTDNKYRKFSNSAGETWSVGILGGAYSGNNGLDINLAVGRAPNYMTQYYANASYTLPLQSNSSILLDGYYLQGHESGHKYGDSSYKSKLWNAVTQLSIDNFSAAVSYQAVIGDSYSIAWSDDDPTSFFTWNSVTHLDFNRKNEKSWQGKLNYDFDSFGLTGLSAMVLYVSGEYRDSGANRREWERDAQVQYNFKKFGLEGLSVTWINATVRTARTITAGSGQSLNENRLIVDYTLQLI